MPPNNERLKQIIGGIYEVHAAEIEEEESGREVYRDFIVDKRT